ncbi:N-acetyltransferase family protein [Promicromonospora sp. CA-289599]|uniref:GNAT family N-acetyltransferase n=1 Tax=Promicromonospora sp. CA-289599 TaxID=3240014 RepID=UPI003D92D0EA
MTHSNKVGLVPITPDDLPRVGEFLSAHLDSTLTPDRWARSLRPTWTTSHPDHGFLLESDGQVVGVYAGIYSETGDPDRRRAVCNLAAWCVLEEFRQHSLRLVRAMLAQRDRELTDLSPSGTVVPLNERLGFRRLDTSGALVVNLALPTRPGVRLLSERADIEAVLTGGDLAAYRDHADSAAARHVVAVADGRPCWVVFRRVRRKRLGLFASVLHVSDRDVFRAVAPAVYRHILLAHRLPFTLVQTRVCGTRPWHSVRLSAQRPMMYLSRAGEPSEPVTYLYSELTQVPW